MLTIQLHATFLQLQYLFLQSGCQVSCIDDNLA